MSWSMTGFVSFLSDFSFSLSEVLSLIGLVQSVAVIVYILFRAGHIRHVVVPVLCFLVLGGGFLLDLGASRLSSEFILYPFIQNGFWLALPAFSILLIIQVADLGAFPKLLYWINLLIPFLAVGAGWVIAPFVGEDPSCRIWMFCELDLRFEVVSIFGIVSGLLCFLALWIARGSFETLRDEKENKGERFWLIISFVIINLLFIFVTLLSVSDAVPLDAYILLRDVLGVGMAYVASTSLFRIYPPSIRLNKNHFGDVLNDEDRDLANKLSKLLDLDKVYQELNFSRTDLARELDTSEARVSKLVNVCFGKSLPQVINERRVRDSLSLLIQTDAQMTVVCEQVGFNSVPTFNRVFKEVMGISPSEYRQSNKKQSVV
ncbi:MAG TPA: helix-turn-helix domain-containing protein [Alphaproteobacteria bacterium]|nr:helix-turn-helix domain-containing protein [Alphaproteobacteria bacterium]